MSRYPDYDQSSSAGDWMMNTVRRNPEGLLLLAAGCALLLRSGASPLSRSRSADFSHDKGHVGHDNGYRGRPETRPSSLREGISRSAEGAVDYVSDVKDRFAETASSYASSVSEYVDETRRNISDQSLRLTREAQSTLQTGMDRMLREQPLAVAILGVAAGAAVAAVFPATDIESQALGGARDALADVASKAGESLRGAAEAAGQRLKSAAAEHGLNQEGLKEIARDVAGTFSNAVTGKPDEDRSLGSGANGGPIASKPGSSTSPSLVPKNSQPGGPRGPR
jgi:hypothetical protein